MNNPKLFPRPFCENGIKNAIPVNRSEAGKPELATLEDGFPPVTMTPKAAGGKPPHGGDFNGILNQITEHLVFLSKGGRYRFDDAFATVIGGYAKGTILQGDNDDTNEYISTIDNNTINFNANPSAIGNQWVKYNNAVSEDDLKKLFVGYYDSVPATKQLSEIIYVPANGLMYWDGTKYIPDSQTWFDSAPVGFSVDWEGASLPSEKWLRYDGSTFDPARYPKLAALGWYANNKLPDVSDKYIRYIGNRTDKYLQYQTMEDAQQAWEGRFWANDLNTSQAPTGVASIVTSRNSGAWTGDRWSSYLFNISNVGAVRTADENRPKTIMFRTKIVKAA